MAIKLPEIIGMPPDTHVSEKLLKNSMPFVQITPAEPVLQTGLTVFQLKSSMTEYTKILKNHGFEPATKDFLKIAFIADNFPTDSFTNEYGESFLNKLTDVVSQGAGEISQMMGAENVGEATGKLSEFLKSQGGVFETMGGGLEKGRQAAQKFQQSLKEGGKGGQLLAGASGMMSRMMAGARVDFPQVWKNSGFSPSYSLTIRLYNPNPGSEQATLKYIIGPIAAILCLSLPRTGKVGEEANTYNWPFLHIINCPGVFKLNPALISNVSIIKGGDQQQIAWNQVLSIVDVRIDIGSLFNSMLLETGTPKDNTRRPTLKTYLSDLKSDKVIFDTKGDPFQLSDSETTTMYPTETAKKQTTTTESDPDSIDDRVPTETQQKYQTLLV